MSTDADDVRRPKYVTGKPAANDAGNAPAFTLTSAELTALVSRAVTDALTEVSQGAAAAILDRGSLAKALDCSPGQVDKLRRLGMPCIYLGDSPRFELPACLEWLRLERRA